MDEFKIYQIASERLKPNGNFTVENKYRFFSSDFTCDKIDYVDDSNMSLIWIEFSHPNGGQIRLTINNTPDIQIFEITQDARKHVDEDYREGVKAFKIVPEQSSR